MARGLEATRGCPSGEGRELWRGSRRGVDSDRQACSPARALYSMSTAPTAGSIHVGLNWARPAGSVEVEYMELHPQWDQLNICWSFIHVRHRSHTCPNGDLLEVRIPLVSEVQNLRAPSHHRSTLTVVEFRDAVEHAARFCRRPVNGTRCLNRVWKQRSKPRPPSVALCAAIGEPSKGDCTTDGHLQATMIPFVPPLPSPLNIKLVMIQSFTFCIDTGGFSL